MLNYDIFHVFILLNVVFSLFFHQKFSHQNQRNKCKQVTQSSRCSDHLCLCISETRWWKWQKANEVQDKMNERTKNLWKIERNLFVHSFGKLCGYFLWTNSILTWTVHFMFLGTKYNVIFLLFPFISLLICSLISHSDIIVFSSLVCVFCIVKVNKTT